MHLRICAALILLTPAAFANTLDLKTQLLSCQQIANEEQRLSCFDQIVTQLAAQPVVTVVPEVPAAPEAAITRVVESTVIAASTRTETPVLNKQQLTDKFGIKKPNPKEIIEEISSKVIAVELDLRKKLLITLENGQQWRQIDADHLQVNVGDVCIVKRGAIGSFLLGLEGAKKRIRVRRVE